MNGISEESVVAPPSVQGGGTPSAAAPAPSAFRLFIPFAAAFGLLTLAFSPFLAQLIKYSFSVDLYSHIFLVPIISGYLIWTDRARLPNPQRGSPLPALAPALLGLLTLALYFTSVRHSPLLVDRLSATTFAYCCFVASAAFLFLGTSFTKAIAFPLAFFFFISPFPEAVTDALEIGSQKASADVYAWMMSLTGQTFLREGQVFALPGLTIQVAQECSGIRSSFVLFLTSLLAGHMFLRTTWRKLALAFAVIPLGLLRNGFRVYVLSTLSVHWDPAVIHSPLHHRGGPIFFALSLLPFFLFLFWLRKSERAKSSPAT